MIINNATLFNVIKYETLGADRHYHSFCIAKTAAEDVIWLTELVDYHPFQGHQLSSSLYITLRSHIKKNH